MNRTLIALTGLALITAVPAVEPAILDLSPITLPVRVHLVQSETMPAMHTTLMEVDIRRIFGKVNTIWAQAGIRFEIESIGPTRRSRCRRRCG